MFKDPSQERGDLHHAALKSSKSFCDGNNDVFVTSSKTFSWRHQNVEFLFPFKAEISDWSFKYQVGTVSTWRVIIVFKKRKPGKWDDLKKYNSRSHRISLQRSPMAIVTYMLCFNTKCSTTYDSITLTTFPVTKEMFYNLEWRAFAETLFQQCDQIWQNSASLAEF